MSVIIIFLCELVYFYLSLRFYCEYVIAFSSYLLALHFEPQKSSVGYVRGSCIL
jgi:hypothetical protein